MHLEKFTITPTDNVFASKFVFATNEEEFIIYDRNFEYTSIALLNAIIESWKDNRQMIRVAFTKEATWYDLLLINYPPGDILKLEIYHEAMWDLFEDDGEYQIPKPIHEEFTSHHAFAYLICNEIKRLGPSIFENEGLPYPSAELEILRKMMVERG